MRLTLPRVSALALGLALVAGPVAFNAPSPIAQEQTAAADPSALTQRSRDEIYADLALFGDVFDRIRSEYVDAPDEKALLHAAIQGMLQSLDPHSAYLEPEDYADVRQDTSGQFGGLGIEVTMEDGLVKVVSPIDDTPASRAGILTNDLIVELDGQQVLGMTLDEAVGKMRGPIGSTIKLTVVRDGVEQPLTFELARDTIAVRAVRWEMEDDIAVVRLSRFSEQAYPGLRKAIEDIYRAREDVAPQGIVFDLRNNPGGLVDQAIYVADVFLPKGAVVLTRGRADNESARYDARADALDARLADVPVVVLVNGGSASAAEIVAGALQDHRRATLVGTRTFGKGSVQSIISLGPNGAMRLTTARYYTPNNRSIQAAGIQPDIVVYQDVPEELRGRDELLGEAGLARHIGGGTEEVATQGSSVYVPSDKQKDNQLQYAIKLLRGEEQSAAFPPQPQG